MLHSISYFVTINHYIHKREREKVNVQYYCTLKIIISIYLYCDFEITHNYR